MNPDEAVDPTALTRLQRLGGAAFVREMIDLYLDYAPGRIAAAQAALAAGDLTALGQAVHPLRSGSGNLGAMGMVALAQRIEQAGKDFPIDDDVEILASEDMLAGIGEGATAVNLGRVSLRGREEPITVYRLT